MAEPTRRLGNRPVVLVCALVGAAAGLFWCLTTMDDPTVQLVGYFASETTTEGKKQADLMVFVGGRVVYTRTAPDMSDFEAELAVCRWGPPLFVIWIGAVIGGVVGHLAWRWLLTPTRSD